mmetsp:Transcript_25149/g.68164  ORF Transcript_25149/g.68164 Transcript_25149/m.68164 type:complete len:188 (+) Transcript_25149:57-620(+)
MAQQQQWAGNFDCSVCRRKRLVGAEFSKNALEKYRRDPTIQLKCKACVELAAKEERAQAAERQNQQPRGDEQEEYACSACSQTLPGVSFSRAQLSKGPDKRRCQECISTAEAAEMQASAEKYQERLREAKLAMQKAEATGTAAEKLATSSAYSAIEAEKVTGLKPIKLSGGRGHGRGRGRGRLGRGG